MQPALVQLLLNDIGDNLGELPVLQHALQRTYAVWKSEGSRGEVMVDHYAAAGRMERALDSRADSIYHRLPEAARPWAEKLFRCLTTIRNGRVIRRPASLERIQAVTGAADSSRRELLQQVISAFSDPEASFLVVGTDSVIDISHEGLIRNWRRLRGWLEEEAGSEKWYGSLADDAARFQEGKASPWRDPELALASKYRDRGDWNEAWAKFCFPDCETPWRAVMEFLDQSAKIQDRERVREGRLRRLAIGALAGLLLATIITSIVYRQMRRNEQARAADVLSLQANPAARIVEGERAAYKLREVEAALKISAIGQTERDQLQEQKRKLEELLPKLQASEERERKRFAAAADQASKLEGDYAASIARIKTLQDQVKALIDDREDLQRKIDIYAMQLREASNWRTRAMEAETQLKNQRPPVSPAKPVPGAPEPAIMALPQESYVRLTQAPFNGQVALLLGDLNRLSSARAKLYVEVPPRVSIPAFTDNPKQAQPLLRGLLPMTCPGTTLQDVGAISCFEIRKHKANADTQAIGYFQLGSTSYAVVATGWTQTSARAVRMC
jgi:hypothetical protein